MNARVDAYTDEDSANVAVTVFKRQHYANIVKIGPLDLIEGVESGTEGWLVIASRLELMIAGAANPLG